MDEIARQETDTAPAWLGEVAALAAHELGNAITEISFAADNLQSRQPDPEALCEVDELQSVVARASTLVRLLARLMATPTPAVQIDVRDVIADALPLLRRLGGRPLEASLPDAPLSILASRSHLERALFEIVLAASRCAEPDGAKRLSVECSGPRDRLRIVVEAERQRAGGAACDVSALPIARALAAACDGAVTLRDLPRGALRIEVDVR